MTPKPLRLPPWLILIGVVLVITASALVPLHEPRLPGTLRIGVFGGEDPAALRRALRPFAETLGQSVRRSSELIVLAANQGAEETSADLLLVPVAVLGPQSGQVLAWAKPVGRSGARVAVVLVRRSDAATAPQSVVLGDSTLLGGPSAAAGLLAKRGIEPSRWSFGSSVFRHDEALALLRHGAVDAAVVARPELDAARARGWFRGPHWDFEEIGAPRPRLALVATASLSGPARDRIRERALELDHLRYGSRDLAVGTALQGLAELGIGGFAPTEPFPALRR